MPPTDIRVIRDVTRARTAITDERSREIQRLEKMLESSGIKLSSVATDLVGVSGRAMLEALINGQDDPTVLADLAKARMRSKTADPIEALTGRFNEHHAFMALLFLDRIDAHSKDINRLDMRLHELMAPFEDTRVLLTSIPGISERVADVIIAETGADMSVFSTAAHLASWEPRPRRAPTSQPDGSSPPKPGQGTATSNVPSAPQPSPSPDPKQPTSTYTARRATKTNPRM